MYERLSSGFKHVPIQDTGEGSEPGGQVCDPPPQQLHSTPSEAQYFQ